MNLKELALNALVVVLFAKIKIFVLNVIKILEEFWRMEFVNARQVYIQLLTIINAKFVLYYAKHALLLINAQPVEIN